MLETLAEDASVRAVVLTGNGISFSAGHDIDWMRRMAEFGREELERHARLLARLLRTLDTLPKPTIAKIQGSAFGLGAGLVACCDVSIAASEALFSFSDVKLGVIPALVAPYMVRAIGERATRRYFMTAERFNAGKGQAPGAGASGGGRRRTGHGGGLPDQSPADQQPGRDAGSQAVAGRHRRPGGQRGHGGNLHPAHRRRSPERGRPRGGAGHAGKTQAFVDGLKPH